ncbi:uncharacterized protein LOC134627360 [Pelmatolapia mariae]|uniref:uncharacterized protein LOC134627360 n=1 Tax=Pelmatolapia mariae TaxID=158779 RepID=UPI002FE6A5BD
MTSAFRTNNMKSCFLLIMFLLTACEMSQQNECRTWVEFTCNKGKATEKHYIKYESKQIPEMVFRELKSEESWEKMCKTSKPSSSNEKPAVKSECLKRFNQIAYRTTKTTIKCDYEGDNKPFFFCKENNSVCENMVSAESPRQSNSRFTFTNTHRNFSLSISNVSSQDEGVYWCGVNLKKEVVIKKIHLNVEHIKNFTRSPAAGQNFTYWCKCKDNASPSQSICKGDDPSICQPLVTTSESDKNKKFFINDKDKTNITVTIINVTADDSGTYWCRAKKNNQQICNRLILTVVSPPTSTSTISSTTATTTATTTAAAAAAGRPGVSEAIISVIICVAVLLFVILMILIYKRFSRSKNTGNGAAACRTKEDCTYEEIQERLQLSYSENATNTIYATVSSPNPAPSTHYATINFQNSDKAAGETVRLSYSACEYSTVKFPKCPTDSSDTQLHRPTEEPLYSTVNKPRK